MLHRSDFPCRRLNGIALLLAFMMTAAGNQSMAGVKTRLYDFESGTVGAAAATVGSSIVGPFTGVPDEVFGEPTRYYDVGPGGIPGGEPLQDWITASYDPSPAVSAGLLAGTPTFVNVANASPLDSPAANSNVGLQFNGDSALQGQGFRGVFITEAGRLGNQPKSDDNTFQSFAVVSQAWVRPDPTFNGTVQTVWAVGQELGGVGITADGLWKHTALLGDDQVSTTPVGFGQWTHLAVRHTGGTATLYVNGTLALTTSIFYNGWGNNVTLGAYENGTEPFKGVIDNFSMVGTGGLGITITSDLDVFSDLGLPTPSGVAGDVDQDGDVDQTDYLIWSVNAGFNNTLGQGDLTTLTKGDLDQNGIINFFDFRVIAREAAAVGATLSLAGAVPEPASGVLLTIGLAAAGRMRRRRRVR